MVAREVRRHQLVAVVAVFHLGVVRVRTQGRFTFGQLQARRVDRLLRLVRRVARQALRHAVVDLHPARDRFGLPLRAPRIGGGDDRLARRLFRPLRRERLDVLDDIHDLPLGDVVPGKHGAAVKALLDDAEEILVVRELPAGHGREFELALREVARRRAEADRSRALPVALHAMARGAVRDIEVLSVVQPARRDLLPSERHRFCEGPARAGASGAARQDCRDRRRDPNRSGVDFHPSDLHRKSLSPSFDLKRDKRRRT